MASICFEDVEEIKPTDDRSTQFAKLLRSATNEIFSGEGIEFCIPIPQNDDRFSWLLEFSTDILQCVTLPLKVSGSDAVLHLKNGQWLPLSVSIIGSVEVVVYFHNYQVEFSDKKYEQA